MYIFQKKNKYLKKERLEDVLALIQVLALDEHAHRSEKGLINEMQSKPKSAPDWSLLAREHSEFFRVLRKGENTISLVIRHVSKDTGIKRPPLKPEVAQALLNTAIELHDRQIKRSQRWTVLIPVWAAVLSGIFILASKWVSNCSAGT